MLQYKVITLNEPVNLLSKLHFSTYIRTWQIFSGPCWDLANSQSWRRHCIQTDGRQTRYTALSAKRGQRNKSVKISAYASTDRLTTLWASWVTPSSSSSLTSSSTSSSSVMSIFGQWTSLSPRRHGATLSIHPANIDARRSADSSRVSNSTL